MIIPLLLVFIFSGSLAGMEHSGQKRSREEIKHSSKLLNAVGEKQVDHRIPFEKKAVTAEINLLKEDLDILNAISFLSQPYTTWQETEKAIKQAKNRLNKLINDYMHFTSESISVQDMAPYLGMSEDVCYVSPLEDEQFESCGKTVYCFSLDRMTGLVIKKDAVSGIEKKLEKTHKFIDTIGRGKFY